MTEGATILASLVPNAIDDQGLLRELVPEAYQRLSHGERATYELAQDLWCGSGPLARFCFRADSRYANALISALTVALGPALMHEHPSNS